MVDVRALGAVTRGSYNAEALLTARKAQSDAEFIGGLKAEMGLSER